MAWTTWDRKQARTARRLADERLRNEAEQRAKQMQLNNERNRMAYTATPKSLMEAYQQRYTSYLEQSLIDVGGLSAYYASPTRGLPDKYTKTSKLKDWQYDYNRLGFARNDGSFVGSKVLAEIGIHQDTELTDDMITSAFVDEKLRLCKENNISGEEACQLMLGNSSGQVLQWSVGYGS